MSSQPSSSEAPSLAFDRLIEPVRKWIWQKGWAALREIQEQAIPAVLDTDADIIIAAATAAGKTEAAFLPIISHIAGATGRGFKAIYISPLKALINDQFKRLDELCEAVELPVYRWHGDVSASIKAKARRTPDGLVLITPESLEALFVRRGAEVSSLFASLEFVVIDELHAFIGAERGRQLQSLLHRLDAATGRSIRRIGLSATLGDMTLAAEFLRPSPSNVTVLEAPASNQELRLQIRGYERHQSDDRTLSVEEKAKIDLFHMTEIAKHVFGTLRGSNGLVFAGSRGNVEVYSDLLRQATEKQGLPEEFFPHHANLTRAHREFVEDRLKDGKLPTSAVCTSTLELGIDIGAIEGVAQIGAPWAVASLRQRLGRSGRRADRPAVLRVYITERQLRPGQRLHPADGMRSQLVQAIAMINLLVAKKFEPPHVGALHLSTLVQQVLAVIAQYGGSTAAKLYKLLCENGAFRSVSPNTFARLLRALGDEECRLIEQTPDGTLLLGERGEKIVDHYDFYAVFQSLDEFRIVYEGKELGTLPVVSILVPGMTIIFSGRRWEVLEIRDREKIVIVSPSRAGVPPLFGGEGGDLHDIVAAEMQRIYQSSELPPYLDQQALQFLDEGREEFRRLGLDKANLVEVEGDTFLFPWAGTIATGSLALALKAAGLEVSNRGTIIEVDRMSGGSVREALELLASSPPPDAVQLAMEVGGLVRQKYDAYLPDDLLALGYAVDRMRADAVPALARRVLQTA